MLYPQDPAVRVERTEDSLAFSWKRLPLEGWLLLLVGVMLGGGGVAAAFMPLNTGAARSGSESAWLVAISLGLALPMVYWGLAYLVNRVEVRADRGRVGRFDRPIPCSKRFSAPSEGIQQFFAVVSSADRSTLGMTGGSIYVMDAQGLVRCLARGLPSSFAANQICHELEDFFGIEDQPVYGVTTDPTHPGPRPG